MTQSAQGIPRMTGIKTASGRGFDQIILDNGIVRAIVVPDLGGKIISLVRIASGREYLISLPPNEDFRKPSFGGTFVEYNNVGFDECIPTIGACDYPEGKSPQFQLPDHGDVWSLSWQHEIRDTSVMLWVKGRSLPFIFRKHLKLQGAALHIEYELGNTSNTRFHYLWSAHPLLATEPGTTILLPLDSCELLIDSSKGNRLGSKGESCTWPIATQTNGQTDDLRLMKTRGKASDKLYTPRLSKGRCGLYHPSANESIVFKFDVESVPYVGLWICHGGIGLDNPKEPFTIAMEPCNGRPDSLREAIDRRESSTLLPHETKPWTIDVVLLEGRPSEEI
jgi:galactose mutarotase-like enzyme